MTRKVFVPFLLALFCTGLAVAEGAPGPKEKAGYALLDQYVKSFQALAIQGSGGVEVLDACLAEMAKEVRKAREEGAIDLVFDSRFCRILAMTKLFIRPDPENILKPVIEREVADFVRDVTGEDVTRSGGPLGIGRVANALAEEIVNLQIYLDTKATRDALRKKLDARIQEADKKD